MDRCKRYNWLMGNIIIIYIAWSISINSLR